MDNESTQVTPEQIKEVKIIGKLKNLPVNQITTKGGLVMLAINKGSTPEILAVGPHIAVAKFIASKKFSNIMFTDLEKSEELNSITLEIISKPWFEISEKFNGLM